MITADQTLCTQIQGQSVTLAAKTSMGIKLKESIGQTEEDLVDLVLKGQLPPPVAIPKEGDVGGDPCLALASVSSLLSPGSWQQKLDGLSTVKGFPGTAWLSLQRANLRISAAPQFYLDGLQCCK